MFEKVIVNRLGGSVELPVVGKNQNMHPDHLFRHICRVDGLNADDFRYKYDFLSKVVTINEIPRFGDIDLYLYGLVTRLQVAIEKEHFADPEKIRDLLSKEVLLYCSTFDKVV